MHSKRVWFGVIITILWILLGVYLSVRDMTAFMAMKPNEWGDFFAGFFAPLAFMWLVLGYLQQGDELKHSTEALRLQAEELQNSVQQQRDLVEVTRQQVEGEREALAYERKLREELSQPKIQIKGTGGVFPGEGVPTYNVSISNSGHDASDFMAKVKLAKGTEREIFQLALFSKGATYNIQIEHPRPVEGIDSYLMLQYADGLGRVAVETYKMLTESNEKNSNLAFALAAKPA